MAEQNMDLDIPAEGEGEAGNSPLPHEALIKLLTNEDGQVDFPAMNQRMADSLIEQGDLTSEQVIAALTATVEDSILYIADIVVSALAMQKALPQGYERTMLGVVVSLENIRLRSFYNASKGAFSG